MATAHGAEVRRYERLCVAILAATLAFAASLTVLGSTTAGQTVSNLGLIAAPLVGAAACGQRAREEVGRARKPWILLGAASLSWAVGQSIWTWYESVLSREVPFPSAADVGYLATVPLVAAALLSFPSAPTRMVGIARTIVDGLTVATAVLLVSWALVLDRVYHADGDGLSRTIALAYPVGDAVTMTIVLLVLIRAPSSERFGRRTLGLLCLGLAVFSVADSGFAYLTATDSYSSGNLIDLGWFAGFALVAVAALQRSDRSGFPLEAAANLRRTVLVPDVAVVTAIAVLAVDVATGERDSVVVVAGVVLLALMLGRQALIGRENVALTTDLEERVRSRTEELRRSEETLRLLIERVADHAIFLLAPDATVASWNAGAQRLFGYSADAVVGAPLGSLQAEGMNEASALVSTAYDRGVAEGEGRCRRADGSTFEASTVMTSIRDEAGAVQSIVVVVRDVTARRAAEAEAEKMATQLRQKQRLEAVGQLAGGVAHDFNNLLTVIAGTAELLEESVAGGEPISDDIRMITEAAERGAALTRQLLTFSRSGPANEQVLDVREVVGGVEGLLRRSLGDQIRLVVEWEPIPCAIVADRGQLEQVLVNLVVNARDAMPRGGTVRVAVGHTECDGADQVCLEVADQGSGMPPDVQARVFEPFFTTKPPGQGTGLGLATVYGIVTAGGGTVAIDSTPGVGTSLRCYFPVSDDVPDRSPAPPRPPVPAEAAARTVLVVEDQRVVRDLTERMLSRNGFRVLTAADGAAAMAFLADHRERIDLVLTDVIMPGMSGPEVRDAARAARPDIPVLFMSGHTGDFLRAGDGGLVLDKPFTMVALLHAIGTLLGDAADRPSANRA